MSKNNKTSSDLVFGIHAVDAMLRSQPDSVKELLLQSNRSDQKIADIRRLAEARGICISLVAKEQLDDLLPDARHQGVAVRGQAQIKWYEADIDHLVQEDFQSLLILILDGVQDPHNLGACLRSANGAGVRLVLAPKDRAVGLTPVTRKVASGAAETTPFVQVTNLARTIRSLKEQGVWVIGLADDESDASNTNGKTVFDAQFKGPMALVLGAEGKGLRRLTIDLCDELVSIPMQGSVSSLNVSVATGICLYEALRQRL